MAFLLEGADYNWLLIELREEVNSVNCAANFTDGKDEVE
jgi:hypothetical protein